jgi:hypothetical protein
MRKIPLTVSVSEEGTRRLERIAERFGMSRTALVSIVAEEISNVRPESFFEALGAIPADLKARPVGRPAGSKSAPKSEKKAEADQAA